MIKILVLTLLNALVIYSQEYNELILHRQITDKIYLNQYDTVRILIKKLSQAHKFTANSLQSLLNYYTNKENETDNDSLIETFFSYNETLIKKLKEDPTLDKNEWTNYLLGNAYFLHAAENQRLRNSFTAFTYSLKAVSCFERALEINPNFIDAKFPIGLYKFWKSAQTKNIFLFSDEREEGINLINESREAKSISDISINQQLTYILLEEKKFDEAYVLAKKNYYLYNKSITFLWAYAVTTFKYDKYEEASDLYSILWNYYKMSNSTYNKVEILLKLSIINTKLKLNDKSLIFLTKIDSIKNNKNNNLSRVDKKIEQAEELRKLLKE